jgi:hypothetical protein
MFDFSQYFELYTATSVYFQFLLLCTCNTLNVFWTREKPENLDFETLLTAIIRPKSQNSNIRHDGILSVGNFMLMINNHFALFQLPGSLSKTKKSDFGIVLKCIFFGYIGFICSSVGLWLETNILPETIKKWHFWVHFVQHLAWIRGPLLARARYSCPPCTPLNPALMVTKILLMALNSYFYSFSPTNCIERIFKHPVLKRSFQNAIRFMLLSWAIQGNNSRWELLSNGQLALAYFNRFGKRNNFVQDSFSNLSPFSSRKLNLKTTLHVPVDFLPKTAVIFEFSNRVFSAKKGSNWKKFFYKVVFFLQYEYNKLKKKQAHFLRQVTHSHSAGLFDIRNVWMF